MTTERRGFLAAIGGALFIGRKAIKRATLDESRSSITYAPVRSLDMGFREMKFPPLSAAQVAEWEDMQFNMNEVARIFSIPPDKLVSL